jgi:hypothetical protein
VLLWARCVRCACVVVGAFRVRARRAHWPDLPPECQTRPPNTAHVQPFKFKQKMNYHTDTRPNKKRKRKSEVLAALESAPTLSINLFEDFLFWTIPISDGNAVDGKQTLDYNS